MRKFGLLLLAAVTSILISAPTVSAQVPARTAASKTFVSGSVTGTGNRVSRASVRVTCNGATSTASTGGNGSFRVQFDAAACPSGSTATVTASKDGQSGMATASVTQRNRGINEAVANITVTNVAVPELGTVIGMSVAAMGAGAFIFMTRRRQSFQF